MIFGDLTSSNGKRATDLVDAPQPQAAGGDSFRAPGGLWFSNLRWLFDRLLEHGGPAIQPHSAWSELPALSEVVAGVPAKLGLSPVVRFRVIVEGREKDVKPSLRDEVCGIVREAIVNAYRHSAAKDIEAHLVYRRRGLRISVWDNGCGIDANGLQWERSGRFGISGMRERAERIGGQLRILSRVAMGTEVELRVPGSIAFA